jgi:hypothetical protein
MNSEVYGARRTAKNTFKKYISSLALKLTIQTGVYQKNCVRL